MRMIWKLIANTLTYHQHILSTSEINAIGLLMDDIDGNGVEDDGMMTGCDCDRL